MAGAPQTVTSFNAFLQLVKPRLTTPQFFWFLGHVSTIVNTLLYLLFSVFSQRLSQKYYNYALLSIITTYLIVILQVFKSSKALSFFNLANIKNNDNFQYLSLAVTWYFVSNTKIVSGGLYPFIIFSTFHTLNYFKNYFLPILPNVTKPTKEALATKINAFITQYNEQSLILATNSEVFILVNQVITSPFILYYLISNFKLALVSIVLLVQYAIFIKLRYRQSKHTKGVFDSSIYQADVLMNSGRVPAALVNVYHQLKQQAIQLVGLIPF